MDNTLILFMSDNGACAEPYEELGGGKVEEVNNPASSFAPTYGRAWAQVSNTPFRNINAVLMKVAFLLLLFCRGKEH